MNAVSVTATIAPGRRQLVNVRRELLLTAKMRVVWLLVLFAVIAATALFRIALLGVLQPASSSQSMHDALLPPRGDIVDRNGIPLARAFPAYSLWFNPKAMGDGGSPLVRSPAEVAAALVHIFPDEDLAKLTARLASGEAGYLKRRILPEEANRVHALGEPALESPFENERLYPQGSMAAHVLGFVAADGHGRVGMEQVFDKQLTDPVARAVPSVLSLDTRVQGALEEELYRGMRDSQAKGAAGIVLDVDTGEVLALASLPGFDPNLINNAGAANIFNRMSNQVYELGSVMKPITVAAAIDGGVVTNLAQRYPAGAPLKIGGFEIHDDENFGPSLNVPEALVHSSNIVLAQVGDRLGGHALRQTMTSLGFNERPYIELPARGMPLWPRSQDGGEWSRITTMTVSFGHGIAISPLHLACAYAALVNGGVWRPATLLKVDPGHIPAGRRVFRAATSARMRQLLRMIVADGTGRKANAAGFRVGGKTGSAEKPGAHGYQKRSLITTFAAAFPMDHPRYVVLVTLDEPQGTTATSGQRTAAWNAAPVVGRVIPRIGPTLGIMPDETRDIDISDISPLVGNGNGG
ncbi:MAG: penicillin-binding protein 2 [Novosphingobium sp.]